VAGPPGRARWHASRAMTRGGVLHAPRLLWRLYLEDVPRGVRAGAAATTPVIGTRHSHRRGGGRSVVGAQGRAGAGDDGAHQGVIRRGTSSAWARAATHCAAKPASLALVGSMAATPSMTASSRVGKASGVSSSGGGVQSSKRTFAVLPRRQDCASDPQRGPAQRHVKRRRWVDSRPSGLMGQRG